MLAVRHSQVSVPLCCKIPKVIWVSSRVTCSAHVSYTRLCKRTIFWLHCLVLDEVGAWIFGPLTVFLALTCSFRFCGECLQPCLQVASPLCPLCRMPFDPKKVDRCSAAEKQLSSYRAPCRGCNKKVRTWDIGLGWDGAWPDALQHFYVMPFGCLGHLTHHCLFLHASLTYHFPTGTAVKDQTWCEMTVALSCFPPSLRPCLNTAVCLQVTLVKMRSHISACTKVQEQMANCPKFMPVVPTSQPIPR